MAARIIANAIHIHRDPATFGVATRIPPGRSYTNDDEILRTYVGAHLKLREYMLSIQRNGRALNLWSCLGPIRQRPSLRRLSITNGQSEGLVTPSTKAPLSMPEVSQTYTLEAVSHTSRRLRGLDPRHSFGLIALRRHAPKMTQPFFLHSAPQKIKKRRIRVQQHAAHLDASRDKTFVSRAVAAGTQGETKSSSPYRWMLSFVNNNTHKGKKPWCSRNQ